MKKTFKKLITIVLALAMVFNMSVPSMAAGNTLDQLHDTYVAGSGTFTLSGNARLLVVSENAPTGELLQTAQLIQRELAAEYTGSVLEMVWGPSADYGKDGDIVLDLDTSSGIGADGYELAVSNKVVITASNEEGLIYGANMLMKYFNYVGKTLTGFTVTDVPDTAERTISLDCGRKYYSAEWIKNFIRQMSWMGYNTLQLHFSEDGGMRADFWDSNYYTSSYSPSNDFSWLCGSEVQYWVYNGNKNNTSYDYQTDPDADKYLTTKELIDICNVAAEYHIDIIPSFDSPAHMDYITWRYEKYAKSNGFSFTYGGTTYTANSSKNYCINFNGVSGYSSPNGSYAVVNYNSGSVGEAFTLALYSDIADFFKEYAGSTDFSIGADEVPVSSYDAFVNYINKLNRLLNNKGYTMRMYNDFMGSTEYNYSSSTSTSNSYTYDSNIEIMYWDSPFNQNNNSSSGTATVKANVLAKEGFTLYNCIQSNCYYVLRVANASSVSSTYKYMDARHPNNLNWSFNYSTEQRIYETWTPNDFGEKGKYSTTDTVSSSNIGGAYFLIWNDYAALNTEKEVWDGVYDNTGTDNSQYYSLFDRMWSNTIKMWNWDVDDTVDYNAFKTVRDTFGWFPGFVNCSSAASLPAASSSVTKEYLADHSALEAALANKISNANGTYSENSYSNYEATYADAEKVNARYDATADEIAAAISALEAAKDALYVVVDNSALVDKINELSDVNNDKAQYTEESYSAFVAAMDAAKAVAANDEATKEQIDSALASLKETYNNLIAADNGSDGSTITSDKISIEKLTEYARHGKKVGLRITTDADVESLVITNKATSAEVTLALCVGQVQTLQTKDDEGSKEVKLWLVYIDADTKGTFTYVVNAGSEAEQVTITVR